MNDSFSSKHLDTKQQYYYLLFLMLLALTFGIQQVNLFSATDHSYNVTTNERLSDTEGEREALDLPLPFVSIHLITQNILSYQRHTQHAVNTTTFVVSFVRPFLRAPPAI